MAVPSDPPRRSSLRPSPAQVLGGIKWFASTMIAIGSTLIATYRWIDDHATEAEVDAKIGPLLDRLADEEGARRALAAELAAARAEAERTRQAVWWAYWWRVGEKAAELERSPERRSQAARRARDRFEGYYQQGLSAEDAYRRALDRGLP